MSACTRSVSVIKELSEKCDSRPNVRHLPKHIIKNKDENPVTYKCTICCKTFKSKSNCCYHKHCADGTEKPYSCSVCGRRFSAKTHYTYHCLMHTGVNPHKCTQCSKSFKTKSKLLRHQEVHLEKRKDHACDICGRLFLRKASIKVHKRSHTGEKRYGCSYCPKTFNEKKNLIHHISTHTHIKNWVCEICGHKFAVKWNLELHKQTHIGSRAFRCPESGCPLSFSQNRYLKRHKETHNSVKYECPVCEHVFSRKDNLQRHIANTHLEHQLSNSKKKDENEPQKQVQVPHNVSLNSNVTVENSEENRNHCIPPNDNDMETVNEENAISNVKDISRITKGIGKNCTNKTKQETSSRESVIKLVTNTVLNNRVSVIKKVGVVGQNFNDSVNENCPPKGIVSYDLVHKQIKGPRDYHENEFLRRHKGDTVMNDWSTLSFSEKVNYFQEGHYLYDIRTDEKCTKKSSNAELSKSQCFLPKKIITASYKECSCSACANMKVSDVEPNLVISEGRNNLSEVNVLNVKAFKSKKYSDGNNLLDLSMKSQE